MDSGNKVKKEKKAVSKDDRLSLYHSLGVTGLAGSLNFPIQFATEREIVHPVGKHVAVYDLSSNEMRFLSRGTNTNRKITAMAVSKNKKVVAICEGSKFSLGEDNNNDSKQIKGENINNEGDNEAKFLVSIYHIGSQRKMRQMSCDSKYPFNSCEFSSDSKYLATISGNGEFFNIVYWKWESETILSSNKSIGKATQVRVHNTDTSIITCSGPKVLKMWKMNSEFVLKPVSLLESKIETSENFIGHVWTMDGVLVAITESSKVYVMSQVSKTNKKGSQDGNVGNPRKTENGYELTQLIECEFPISKIRLESIESFNKGFILVGTFGYMAVYESSSEIENSFMLIKTFSADKKDHFVGLTVSEDDEQIVCYTRSNKLLNFPLGNIDMLHPSENHFKTVLYTPHGDHVSAMSVCGIKPIIATVCSNRLLRIVNYKTWECELVQTLNNTEEVTSIDIHPSGTMLLVAWKERVKLFAILMHELDPIGEIQLRQCKEAKFSRSGHCFACASGVAIHLYETYTASLLNTFCGHIGAVKCISFNSNDTVLQSGGIDGTVYGWNISTGSQIEPLCGAIDNCQILGVAGNYNCDTGVASCSDNSIREFSGEKIKFSTPPSEISISQILLSSDEKTLFAGCSNGNIRAYKWPLSKNDGRYVEYTAHTASINKLCINPDQRYIFSSADDSTVFAFKTKFSIGDRSHSAKRQSHAESWDINPNIVMVTKKYVNQKENNIEKLKKLLADTEANSEYTLHVKDNEWQDKLKALKEDVNQAILMERERYDELQNRYDLYVRKHIEELEKRDGDNVRMTQELENEYEMKLAIGAERYDKESETNEALRQTHAEVIEKMNQDHQKEISSYKDKLADQEEQLRNSQKKLYSELENQKNKNEEATKQLENEYELEILRLKEYSKNMLETEKQSSALKQGQLTQQRNKYSSLRSKIAEMKAIKLEDNITIQDYERKISSLEATIKQYERNFKHREETSREAEKKIAVLRSNNKTLDNFRYVLDYRIERLTEEKGPIQEHIKELEAHIRSMYEELMNEFHRKREMDTLVVTKDMKIETREKEVAKLRVQVREKDREISLFHHAISNAAKIGDAREAKATLYHIYKVYVEKEKDYMRNKAKADDAKDVESNKDNTSNSGTNHGGESSGSGLVQEGDKDFSCVNESVRQRDYMEKTLHGLKRALALADKKLKEKTQQSVRENAFLITECNRLRKEALMQQHHARDMEEKVRELKRQQRKKELMDSSKRPFTSHGSLTRKQNRDNEGNRLNHDFANNSSLSFKSNSRPSSSRSFERRPKQNQRQQTNELMQGMLQQLDENNREIIMQRSEIQRLRAKCRSLEANMPQSLVSNDPVEEPSSSNNDANPESPITSNKLVLPSFSHGTL